MRESTALRLQSAMRDTVQRGTAQGIAKGDPVARLERTRLVLGVGPDFLYGLDLGAVARA